MSNTPLFLIFLLLTYDPVQLLIIARVKPGSKNLLYHFFLKHQELSSNFKHILHGRTLNETFPFELNGKQIFLRNKRARSRDFYICLSDYNQPVCVF